MYEWSQFHPNTYSNQPTESIWPGAIGAFLGAFSAFIFGLITFYFQKRFERYWKHKNAVVEIEHLLQSHLNQNSSNQFLFNGAIDTLQRNHMTYTILTELRLPDDLSLRIGDIDILNRYFDYQDPIEKINHGAKTWQGMNEQLQQSITGNPNLPAPIVHKTMEYLENQARSLLKFMEAQDIDTRNLLAYIRIYLRKDRHIWSIWWLKRKNNHKPIISEDEVEQEIKMLQKEIDEISKKSRDDIAKIVGN